MNYSALTTIASSRLHANDFVEMTKPRLSLLVLFSVAATGFLATGSVPDFWMVLHTVVGTALIAASASVANQYIERRSDAKMARTAGRPIPSGRVRPAEAIVFATILGVVGGAYLLVTVSPSTALLGMMTWLIYVVVYTPLKRISSLNTVVGALAGAMPVLIGWSGTGIPTNANCWAVFLLLFFWQFPHFMAIAWKYRHDYAAGDIRMLPVVHANGISTGVVAVLGAVAVLFSSLVPAIGHDSAAYVAVATLLGFVQLSLAIRFLILRDEQTSKSLLRGTLIYLPLILLFLVIFQTR